MLRSDTLTLDEINSFLFDQRSNKICNFGTKMKPVIDLLELYIYHKFYFSKKKNIYPIIQNKNLKLSKLNRLLKKKIEFNF